VPPYLAVNGQIGRNVAPFNTARPARCPGFAPAAAKGYLSADGQSEVKMLETAFAPPGVDVSTRSAHANPRDPAFFQNPYAFYEKLHRSARRFKWEDYGHWCFAGFDDVNRLLRDKRFGRQILHVATREELGWAAPGPHTADFDATEAYSLLSLEPPAHTRLRTLVNRAFVSRNVERLRSRVVELANEIIDGFIGDGRVELIRTFAAPIPAIVIAELIGLPAEMAPSLLDWSNRMVRMYMFGRTREIELDSNQAARDFVDYLETVIAERRRRPREDLLTHMIVTEQGGERLSQAEIVSTAILLLNAGHEATVHTTGNAVKAMLESGLDPAELFASPAQTEATVEECLRYDAPLHLFTRYALSDVELDDHIRLRKGDEIGLMLGAANRDPTRFSEPNRFDPFRSDGGNISFGAGIHFCIGAPLARIELQEALSTLFARLPGLRIAGQPEYGDVYHFHGLKRLDLEW
jgi:unspecific monooxygenase